MFVVKEQSKKNPNGVQVSPIMDTKDGADTLCELLRKHCAESAKATDDPKFY